MEYIKIFKFNNEQVKELLKNPYIFDFITADKDVK